MKRKRFLIWILAVAIMLLCAPTALAEEVRITVTATPAELSEAGSVELNFTISNYSDYELHNVTITSGGMAFVLSDGELIIPPNGSANDVKLNVNVPESQIGLASEYTVSWTQAGEPKSQNVSVTINRAADPVISVSRTLSKNLAKEGEQVTVEYVLTNSTKFDMTDIQLIDDQISDKAITKIDSLLSGNSMKIEHNYVMGTADAVSAPVVTYAVRGKTKSFSAIEPATIGLMLVKLSLDVKAGTPTASGVQFTLDLKNIGNQAVKDITIFDDKNNFVTTETFSMEPGDASTYSYLVSPSMTEPVRNVSFKVSGVDAQGNPYTLEPAQRTEVYPYVEASQISTGLRAETLEPWDSQTGVIKVRLIINNASAIDLSNVQVSELSMGIIKLIEKLDKGETTMDLELSIGSPRNLAFTVKGVDPAGAMRDLGSAQLQVAYSGETAVPTETPQPESIVPSNGIFSFLTGTLSKILLVLGGLMGAAFITLLILSVQERKRMSELELDTDFAEPPRPRKKRPPERIPPERVPERPRRNPNVELIGEAEPASDYRRSNGDTQRVRRPGGEAAPSSRNSSMRGRQGQQRQEGEAEAYRYQPAYRPPRTLPPEDEIIPVEVEYDDESMEMLIDEVVSPPAPQVKPAIRLTDGTDQGGPKVIRSHEAASQKAAPKDEIRRIKRHDDK